MRACESCLDPASLCDDSSRRVLFRVSRRGTDTVRVDLASRRDRSDADRDLCDPGTVLHGGIKIRNHARLSDISETVLRADSLV